MEINEQLKKDFKFYFGREITLENLKDMKDGHPWVLLVVDDQPELMKYCPWDVLNGAEWSFLLAKHPEYAEHCDWSKLGGYNWYYLLRNQTKFKKYCDWGKLSDVQFETLEKQNRDFKNYKKAWDLKNR